MDFGKTLSREAVIRIIYREHKGMYTKERIAERIEKEGASTIDPRIQYIGFGRYIITNN